MPVPNPGSKVGSDNQKVKFLTIFGRPKTGFFDKISGVPGRAPLATNHAVWWGALAGILWGWIACGDPFGGPSFGGRPLSDSS